MLFFFQGVRLSSKMTDSMKFGPEWLRNITQDTSSSTPTMSGPKYQLAEFRYGREEMLALFDEASAAPEPLKNLSGLYVDKTQPPLALISVTDEETRMWNRGINSDAVLRANRAAGGGPLLGGVGPTTAGVNLNSSLLRGGRGGSSIDRGRGRNLRGSSFHYPPHRTNYDEYSDLMPSFVRSSRPFERTQSQGSERNWLDRNGTTERSMDRGGNGGGGGNESSGSASEWSGGLHSQHHSQLSSSPRKEFPSRSGLADSNNWRKHRGAGESSDSDGWRSTSNNNNGSMNQYDRSSGNEKWERNSWREPSDRVEREREKESDDKERGMKWERRPWENHEKRVRRMTWDSADDSLPEWATENPSETGGSFDASGAFYRDDVYSDEEEPPRGKENHLRQHDEPFSKSGQPRNRRLSSCEDEKHHYMEDSPEKSKANKQQQREDSALLSSSNKQPLEQRNDNQSVDQPSVPFHRSNSKPETVSPKKSPTVQNSSQIAYNSNSSSSPNSSQALKHSQSASNLSNPLASPSSQSVPVAQNSVPLRNATAMNSAPSMGNDLNSKPLPSMGITKSESTSKVPNPVHNTLLHNSSAPSLTCYTSLTDRYQSGNGVPSLSQVYNNKEAGDRHLPKADETFARMQEVADDIVAKLVTDDEDVPPTVQQVAAPVKMPVTNRWYYRDPQGARQGPFSSTEMAEWFKSGYFQVNLLVRRECDETYAPLGELMKLWGRVPFLADNIHPPIKSQVDPALGIPSLKAGVGAQLPLINCVKPPETGPTQYSPTMGVPQMEDEFQYQYRQLMLRQQAVAFQSVLSKLSQTERWNTLTTAQQQELIVQQMNNSDMTVLPPLHNPSFVVPPEPIQQPQPQPPPTQQTTVPPSNPLMNLLAQMGLPVSHEAPASTQMSPIPQQPPQPQSLHHHQPQPQSQSSSLDPWQQFIQKLNTNNLGGFSSPAHHLGGMTPMPQPPPPQPTLQQSLSTSLHSHSPSTNLLSGMPDDVSQTDLDPVQRLLRQLGIQHQVPPSQQQSTNKVDSLWGSLNSNLGSSPTSWMPSQPLPAQSSSIWGDHTPKVMKTEQEVIKEQLQHVEETKKIEKLRKQQEKEKLKKLEEEANKKATEDKKKKVEEKKKKETETKEKKKQEEDKKKKLEEETKKKEEDKKRKDEEKKKKEDDKKKKEDEKRKKEEKDKKKKQNEEDKDKKKPDDDKKKKDNESKRKDEDQKEGIKRVENDKSLSENSKSQDQKGAGPVKQPWSSQTIATPSLADIQKIEREKKIKQQMKEQQQLAEMAAARSANPEPPQTGFQLKWAETKNPPTVVKSLAEIQAEEQKQLAKQLERERAERLQQAKEVQIPASSCIWANQNLTWNTNQHNSVWGSNPPANNSSGFWDNIANNTSNSKPSTNIPAPGTGNVKAATNAVNKSQKTSSTVSSGTVVTNSNNSAVTNNKNVTNSNNSAKATKGNKQKETNMSPKATPLRPAKNDEFSQWCHKAISNIKTSVDVPTFVGFLRDIESPFEVKDYCKAYLGDSKEASEFARQFIERRSKWRAKMTNKNTPADDISAPAPALPAEFTEVKGKNKKTKKKPTKVDSRILGFVAHDRISTGDSYGAD
ncbi:GIGYF family protein Gyf isoform X1 [Bemisia tabaci]